MDVVKEFIDSFEKTNLLRVSKRTREIYGVLVDRFSDICKETYVVPRGNKLVNRRLPSVKELYVLLKHNVTSLSEWPLCKVCNQRRVNIDVSTLTLRDVCKDARCTRDRKMVLENPMKLDEVKEKFRVSLMSKYGVSNVSHLDYMKDLHKQSMHKYWSREDSVEQRAISVFEKYGVFNVNQLHLRDRISWICEKLQTTSRLSILQYLFDVLSKKLVVEIQISFSEFCRKIGESDKRVTFKCKKCGALFEKYIDGWVEMLYHYLTTSDDLLIKCPCCSVDRSRLESVVINKVLSYLPSLYITTNDKRVISPYEVDILVNGRFGIEVDGIYFHSSAQFKHLPFTEFVDGLYRLRTNVRKKIMREREVGLPVCRILETEIQNQSLFESWISRLVLKICNYLRLPLPDVFTKIGARECEIVPISSREANQIHYLYNIHGAINIADRHFAFLYKDHIVGVFSVLTNSNRVGIGIGKSDTPELLRYTVIPWFIINGGTRKLLAYLFDEVKVRSLKCFVDGRLCNVLPESWLSSGLRVVNEPSLFYYIIDGDRLHHRFWIRSKIPKNFTETRFIYESKYDVLYTIGSWSLRR